MSKLFPSAEFGFYVFMIFPLKFHALTASRVNHKTILWLIINTLNCNRKLMYHKAPPGRERFLIVITRKFITLRHSFIFKHLLRLFIFAILRYVNKTSAAEE
jgi:hypothetical protein